MGTLMSCFWKSRSRAAFIYFLNWLSWDWVTIFFLIFLLIYSLTKCSLPNPCLGSLSQRYNFTLCWCLEWCEWSTFLLSQTVVAQAIATLAQAPLTQAMDTVQALFCGCHPSAPSELVPRASATVALNFSPKVMLLSLPITKMHIRQIYFS